MDRIWVSSMSHLPSLKLTAQRKLLLMAEILHQLIGSLSYCLQGFSTIPGSIPIINFQMRSVSFREGKY